MTNPTTAAKPLNEAFVDYERPIRIQNYKVGCILALVFMPAGAFLDYFVYPDRLGRFLGLRLLCSLLLGVIWCWLHLRPGFRFYRVWGLLVALLPLGFIAWMILETEGAQSPYYAGLNLVMLGAAILLRWTLFDSLVVFLLAMSSYLAACAANGPIRDLGTFFNNLYFLSVTGVFIVIGSWFYNRIRYREFELRYQLDANRRLLEATNQRLRDMDQAKSQFFANISHELRTPLTLLLAPLENLIAQKTGRDPQEHDLLLTMQASGMRLLKLINDLLDLVKLESGRLVLKWESIEVKSFLEGLANSVRHLARNKGLEIETAVAESAGIHKADPDKLEKIVLNLLFNSLKFTPPGGRVSLRAQRHNDQLVLEVSDTGMGIADEHQPFIFERFWQVDASAQRKSQGVGIGLALVRELVEAHGGQVSVRSQAGRGTTITVRLPDGPPASQEEVPAGSQVSPPESPAAPAVPSAAPNNEWLARLYHRAELFPPLPSLRDLPADESFGSNGRPRVLVADDEPDMLRFLRLQLTGQFEVTEAVDGQQAIEKARQFLPDLILCDLMMPEKDGLQVCRELRAHTPTQGIPIVLLTARADEETKLAALSAGATDFLTKPFSTSELHLRLSNLVTAHELQRQLAWQNHKLEATLDQLKDTELQLVQTEKMAALGRMSAGLIHEINNPLNYAKTGLYTLRNKSKLLLGPERELFEEVLLEIEDGVDRIRDIVTHLRTFSHPRSDKVSDVLIETVVDSALRFLSHDLKDQVRIERQLQPDHRVNVSPAKLIQVLVNLIDNALDALRCKEFSGETPTIWIESRHVNGADRIVIRDNGIGIAPEIRDKVFDPFFTTKDVGAGMGLGLSICYRTMSEQGGRILLRSEPGKFCEFTVELPAEV